jgi:short-subunit dehydrogenase
MYLAESLVNENWVVTGVGSRSVEDVRLSPQIRYLKCDFNQSGEILRLATEMDHVPDVIINAAAMRKPAPYDSNSLEGLEQLIRINAVAPYIITQALLARKAEDQRCSVIMINSEAAYHSYADIAPYSASKAALLALARALADSTIGTKAAVSTIVLGPLANVDRRESLGRIARDRGLTESSVTEAYVRKQNPRLVITDLIDFDQVLKCVHFICALGQTANGMVCRLDGGASGIVF